MRINADTHRYISLKQHVKGTFYKVKCKCDQITRIEKDNKLAVTYAAMTLVVGMRSVTKTVLY